MNTNFAKKGQIYETMPDANGYFARYGVNTGELRSEIWSCRKNQCDRRMVGVRTHYMTFSSLEELNKESMAYAGLTL